MTHAPDFWAPRDGRELDATPLDDRPREGRVIACLNVWNDVGVLRETMPTWLGYVDHVIAVDGAYDGTEGGLSTDGTREYLLDWKEKFRCSTLGPARSLELIDAPGLSQCEKRTRYFRRGWPGGPGDTLFIIDADESVEHAGLLRTLPRCDVGWVRVRSPLYAREYGQPRLVRWMPGLRYEGRHHWIYQDERLLCTHQYGGPGYAHRPVPLLIHNNRNSRRGERASAKRAHHAVQVAAEQGACAMAPQSTMSDASLASREALQILTYAYRDDGLAPSRLHSAINRTTPHASLFFKRRPGPFDVPGQYMSQTDGAKLSLALRTADVIHCHGALSIAANVARRTPMVLHHHGSLYRANAAEYNKQAAERNALILLSNLELFSWADGHTAHFLPNTVPVARYRALREREQVPWTGATPFRVAHSPSHPSRKGTAEFLAACARLNAAGVPIEPVVIHDQSHRDALRMKATCHAAFDSFWLGMQCSGIEAAAMGLPVIAGDATVAARYVEHFGAVPYTFADNAVQLESALHQLATDEAFRAAEAVRVTAYVTQHHDESAVALRYLDLLDQHFGWRSAEKGATRREGNTYLQARRRAAVR